MKILATLIFLLICSYFVHGQGVSGTILELENNEPINQKDSKFFLEGDNKLISVSIDSLGKFTINKEEIDELGEKVIFQIGTLGTNHHYADFEIINIPKDSLGVLLNRIFVKKAYIISSCGKDCFTIDNKRTYKDREFIVDNGIVQYRVRRLPYKGKIKQSPFFDVKYQTDFYTDIINKN